MVRLLLIRHGESEADLLHVHEGRADFSLTPRGLQQAKALATYVATHYQVDRIYTSPLRRAAQTAALLHEATGAPQYVDDDLMEFDNGLLAGLPFAEAAVRYPKPDALPLHASTHGQESRLAFRYRAERALSKILSDAGEPLGEAKRTAAAAGEPGSNSAPEQAGEPAPNSAPAESKRDRTVAIVSHGGMINRMYHCFLRLPVDTDLLFPTADTGLHEWTIAEGARRIVRANYHDHTQTLSHTETP